MKLNSILRPATLPLIPVLVAALLSAPPAEAGTAALHFDLAKSAPQADSTVAAPTSVKLWFTEVPQEGSVSIRVVDSEGAAIHTADVAQDAEEPTSFSVDLHHTLAAGAYTVAWRGMGSDGHVVRDDFAFTVAAQR